MAMEHELITAGLKPPISMKKRLWNMLRVALFMTRRGVLKHSSSVHVHDEKRRKMVGRRSLMLFHPSSKSSMGVKEYEFSCSSSPVNPGFQFRKKRQLHHFLNALGIPCMHQQQCIDEGGEVDVSKEYTTRDSLEGLGFPGNGRDLELAVAEEDWRTAYSSSPTSSPWWSVQEDGDEEECGEHNVDRQAEAFIAKFYNEMHLQRQFSFSQYREMLERGAN